MKKITLVIFSILTITSAKAYDINSYCQKVAETVGGSYQIEKACRIQEYNAQSKINCYECAKPYREVL